MSAGTDDSDLAALRLLYEGHAVRLARLALLLGAADPEDVVQDAFLRLGRHPKHLQAPHAPAYLQRIVVNLSRDRLAAAALRTRHLVTSGEVPGPDTAVARQMLIATALHDLPPRQREALVLRHWADLPLEQVASAMGVSLGTAKSHVSRGLAALRTALERSRND